MRLDFDSDVIKENGKSMLDHHSCSKGYHERPNNERNAASIPGMNESLQNTHDAHDETCCDNDVSTINS